MSRKKIIITIQDRIAWVKYHAELNRYYEQWSAHNGLGMRAFISDHKRLIDNIIIRHAGDLAKV